VGGSRAKREFDGENSRFGKEIGKQKSSNEIIHTEWGKEKKSEESNDTESKRTWGEEEEEPRRGGEYLQKLKRREKGGVRGIRRYPDEAEKKFLPGGKRAKRVGIGDGGQLRKGEATGARGKKLSRRRR